MRVVYVKGNDQPRMSLQVSRMNGDVLCAAADEIELTGSTSCAKLSRTAAGSGHKKPRESG